MDWLLGSVEEAAERELNNYNPKTGKRKQDFGDWLGDNIFGRKAAIDQAVKDLHVDNIQQNYGTSLNRYGSVVGGEDVSNLERLTQNQVGQRLTANKELAGARSAAGALTGDDISTFQDLNTPEAVQARASKIVRERNEDKEGKKENKEQARHDESVAYQKSRDKEMDTRYALEQERLWQTAQENRKDRALDRQLNAENNAMQMQLEYSRLAQQDRQNSRDRKDKAIMMLMQGLGNLGTAFTI